MSFAEIKDQKQAVAVIQRSLRSGRLAHAYLFIGPRGAGKEALARALAKALNCEKEKTADSCDKCDACRKIDADTHPDVYWVRPESKSRRIVIEKIRDLEKAVYLKPRDGRVKVGIIVDAERMVTQAANAFLKTLEEPPASSVLLLLTTDPQKLPSTIVSRCLPVRMAAVTGARLSELQKRVLAVVAESGAAAAPSPIVSKYRKLAALSALLQSLRQEREQEVRAAWDESQWETYDKHIRETLEEELKAAIEAEYLSAREEVLLTLLAWHRDILLLTEGVESDLLMLGGYTEKLKLHSARLDYSQAKSNVDVIEKLRDHLEQNINETLALEVGLLRLHE